MRLLFVRLTAGFQGCGAGGLVKLALVHRVPHWPQDHQSPWSARKTPAPQRGQNGLARASVPSLTVYLGVLAASEAFYRERLGPAEPVELVESELVGSGGFHVVLLEVEADGDDGGARSGRTGCLFLVLV